MKLPHPNDGFQNALRSLPNPGGNGYHLALMGVANRGIIAGVDRAELVKMIRAYTPEGGRVVPDSEIHAAVEKAARECTQTSWRPKKPQQHTERFDASAFMAACLRDADSVGESDIWDASPVHIDWPPERDAVELLRALYQPDDILFAGDTYGTVVKPAAAWIAEFENGNAIPPHIIPNPLSGRVGLTKDGKESFRADSCVTQFRFAVAEFDGLPREDQIRFWYAVDLPVCALIDSGGKSLHAWIRIDGIETADAWTAQVEQLLFALRLVPLGCDPACRNEARLSRMPGHFRSEKNRWQRILFLAPEGRRISCKR